MKRIGGNGWSRIVAGICAALAACLAQGAVIVHDAGRDLVLNEDCANVYTNAYGGVWSFMCAASWEPSSPRVLMTKTRLYKPGTKDVNEQEIVAERGPSETSTSGGTTFQLPVIAVNPRHVEDSANLTAAGYPTIKPGQVSVHPGAGKCAILRFTMPRTGVYTVTTKFWNQNKGVFGMTVQTNGVLTKVREAWTGEKHKNEIYDFSIPAATYRAGDTVEFTIDYNGKMDSNAAGVIFRIAEEVSAVIDAGAAMRAHVQAEGASATAAWTDAAGTWRVESVFATNTVKYQVRTLLDTRSVRTSQGSGASGWSTSTSGTPWAHVNATDTYVVETNLNAQAGTIGAATLHRGTALASDELYLHPGKSPGKQEAGVHSVLLGLSPATSGRYDIGVTMRDVSWIANADGVRVHLIQGGHELASRWISCEQASLPQSASIFLRDVAVAAGVPIELVVDQVDRHAADGTGLAWAMVRTSDAGVYSANTAMIANLNAASPSATFTGDGATWKVGTWSNGALTPFTTVQANRTSGPNKAIGNNESTSPYFGANLMGRALTPEETSSNAKIAAGRNMLIAHPGQNVIAALRFIAPTDGIYAAHVFCMDLDGSLGGVTAQNNGIIGQLFVNGHQPYGANICSVTNQPSYAVLDASALHLKAGDFVDMLINPNGSHNCDLTGLHVWLSREEAATELVRVNIDFDATDAQGAVATFVGAGRYGYTGEAWDSFRVPTAAEAKFSKATCIGGTDNGKRTGLELTLARDGVPLVCDAGNTLTTDVGDARSLFVDGVVSTSSDDPVAFTLAGLLPDETYTLVFCSRRRTATGGASDATTIRGAFTVDGVTDIGTHPWFANAFGDYANLTVTADANGVVTGTFASASDVPAYWNGLQVEGPGFAKYVPKMTLILIR